MDVISEIKCSYSYSYYQAGAFVWKPKACMIATGSMMDAFGLNTHASYLFGSIFSPSLPVGGGTSGSVLASRVSEDSKHLILLIATYQC
jgi:hypothetical protein